MATIDQSGIVGKIRNKPIGEELKGVLERAAEAAGIDTVLVTSGSQPGTHGQSTGSTRHNHGRAADLKLKKNGSILTFTDQAADPAVEAFVIAAAASGATGIGAGVQYMGRETLHVGFGTSPQDHTKVVWGAAGRSVNAPAWLRRAAKKGWDNPVTQPPLGGHDFRGPGRFIVSARGGLHLRKGPGLGFDVIKTLETGTKVVVTAFEGPDGEWARVESEGSGLIDGHLFAAFLTVAEPIETSTEEVEEPDDVEA